MFCELALALPIAQMAINDIPMANLINCMLWFCMVVSPNSIAAAYRRRRFQACDGHHKGTTISEDTRTQSLHEKSPTSAGSLALRDNPIAGPSRHPYLIKQQQLRFHRQCNGNLDNGPGRHRIEAPKFDISVGAVTGLS